MNWLPKVFQRKTNPAESSPDKKDFTNVLHLVVEEIIMIAAQSLITFIQQTIDGKITTSQQTSASESAAKTEEITSQVTLLFEQLYDRTSSLLALEQRLKSVEVSLEQQSNQPPSQSSSSFKDSLDDRIITTEQTMAQLLERVGALTQQLRQEQQELVTLEQRVSCIEKLFVKYSVVPKLVSQHHYAIAALQNQLAELKPPQQNNGHSQTNAAPRR
jgi:chromosome segregation ATPase